LRWGLIPSWAKDKSIGNHTINARSETAHEKPAFRSAFKKRRCLILADGFFEWKKDGPTKQPYLIRLKTGKPFAFAGLWEYWDKEGEPLETCSIMTTQANELLKPLHERMPVILKKKDFEKWLDPNLQEPAKIQAYLQPLNPEELTLFPVSSRVNSPRNNDADCIQPLGEAKPK
jgi:putative SOS response-associated peptidase YedK